MDSLDGFLTLPQLSDDIIFMITAMEFAVFGGVVNWLMGEKRSAAGLFTGIIVAGFVGLLTGELCRHYGITGPGAFFLIGSSGLASETLVKMFKRFTVSRIEALIKDDSKKNDNNKLGKILIVEYGIDIVNEWPSERFDAVILAVAHQQFENMDVLSLLKEHLTTAFESLFIESRHHELDKPVFQTMPQIHTPQSSQ